MRYFMIREAFFSIISDLTLVLERYIFFIMSNSYVTMYFVHCYRVYCGLLIPLISTPN